MISTLWSSIVVNWRGIVEAAGVLLVVVAVERVFGDDAALAAGGVALVLFANFGGR
jgi:hypothetical protein